MTALRLAVIAAALMAGTGTLAAPRDHAERQATELLHSGLAHRRAQEFDQAVADFEKAYQLSPQPNFLYLLGETQQEAGRVAEAIAAYRRYLEVSPQAPDRPLVQEQLDTLAQQPKVPAPTVRVPEQPVKLPPGPAPVQKSVLPAPPRELLSWQRGPVRPAASPRVREPLWRRPWLWVAVSAAVLGGVALGVGLALRPTEPTYFVAPGSAPAGMP